MIKTICYGEERDFNTLGDAICFYLECWKCSEGSERERYSNLLYHLANRETYCTDED